MSRYLSNLKKSYYSSKLRKVTNSSPVKYRTVFTNIKNSILQKPYKITGFSSLTVNLKKLKEDAEIYKHH